MIKQHQQDYYDALGQADESADSTHFIVFILQAILKTIEQNAPVNIHNFKTPDAIIELLKSNQYLTRQQMAELIGKDISTIGRAIKTTG